MSIDTILGVVGTVLGIAGLITGYIFYRKSLRTKEPCYAVKTETLIAGYSAKFEDLTILYKDKEIENLSVSRIAFWNNGNETIDKNDIATTFPVTIVASDEVEILDAKVLEQANRSSNFSVHPWERGDYIQILFDYIDKEDGAVFQVIHTGTSPDALVAIVGDIKGTRGVSRKFTEKTPMLGWVMVSSLLIMLWVLTMAFFTIGTTVGFEGIPNLVLWMYSIIAFLAVVLTALVVPRAIKERKYSARVPKGLKSYESGKE